MKRDVAILLTAGLAACACAQADWPQWRGPELNGVSGETGLPTRWSDTENVAWKTPLPSWSGATPIVWGTRVFVMSPSAPDDAAQPTVGRRLPRGGRQHPGGGDILLICLDAEDGRPLWQKVVGSGNALFGKHNMASPSPSTDGQRVYAMTGTGVVAAFTMDGQEVWRRDLAADYGPPRPAWGYGSSPLLYDGKLIVAVLHGSVTDVPSYVAALDAETGKTLWRVERSTDAEDECPDAYTTPVIARHERRSDLIVSGADYVTGHDPSNGRELWRAAGLNPERRPNYRVVASPLAAGELVYVASRVRPFLAFRAGGSGDVTKSHLAWSYTGRGGAPDVPTPTCDGRYLYLVDDRGVVVCLDARSGERVWGPQRTATGTVSASPLLADGKVYITNESAVTTVLAAGPEYKLLATNDLKDECTIASLAPSRGRLFVRTATHLVCIGGAGE